MRRGRSCVAFDALYMDRAILKCINGFMHLGMIVPMDTWIVEEHTTGRVWQAMIAGAGVSTSFKFPLRSALALSKVKIEDKLSNVTYRRKSLKGWTESKHQTCTFYATHCFLWKMWDANSSLLSLPIWSSPTRRRKKMVGVDPDICNMGPVTNEAWKRPNFYSVQTRSDVFHNT